MPPLHSPLLFFPLTLPPLSLPSPSSLVPATAATAAVSCQSVFVLLLALVAVVGATTRCQPGCVCNETLSLSCSDIRRLEAVPADVRSITVTNGKTMNMFSSRPLGLAAANIVHLDLSSNSLTTLTPDSFSGLANLVHLNLSGNHLHNITGGAFAGLRNLATLDLSHNRLSKLVPGVFSDLVNLTFLDLRDNDLPALPADIFRPLQSLEMLNLSQNSITHILVATFSNTSALQELDLSHNLLQTFHEDVLSSFANLYRVNLEGNPIDCSCAVQGLLFAYNNITNTNNPDLFYNFHNLTCNLPASLAGKPVVSSFNLSREVTSCESPGLDYVSANMSRVSHQDVRLDCNATGSPGPSIVWVTPWGDLFAHNMHLHQLTSISQPFLMRHTYTDSKYTSDIYILSNGSLVIQNLRGYFGGRFRCLAINPLGNHSATLVLRVYSLIPSVYTTSLVVSFGASLSFLVLGVLLGAVRTLAIRVATRRGKNFKVRDQGPEIRPVEIEKTESCGGPRGLSGIAEGVVLTDALYYKTHNRTHSSDLPSFGSIPHLDRSPGASPPSLDGRGPGVRGGGVRGSGSGSGRDGDGGGGEDDDGDDGDDDDDHYYAYYYYYYNDDGRCVKVCSPPPTPATPATPGSGLGAGPSSGAHPTHPQQPPDIRETLDEVRARLVDGVERRMLKMRWRVQTIRDTGSQYMHSIRDTGSQCVQTIRAGVVLGVEQVKCHVQSFRELCGTGGTMGAGSSSMAGGYGLEGGEEMTGSHHTISNVSVSTDVDTQTRTEIVKSYTYV